VTDLDAPTEFGGPTQVLLHRPPLLLLDCIQEATEESCLATVRVDPTAWYAEPDGAMPGWFGIELMAQAVSAFSGSNKHRVGLPPRIGFLLGTRDYECRVPRFPAGEALEVEVRLNYFDESGLSAFACEIRQLGQTVARATLKTFEPT
jgi:predicted hotdog family 3-hydroxylacyl-ACP dehydratase